MFLVTFDCGQEIVFINECKSCEISNQMFFNVMFFIFRNKRRTGYDVKLQNKTI